MRPLEQMTDAEIRQENEQRKIQYGRGGGNQAGTPAQRLQRAYGQSESDVQSAIYGALAKNHNIDIGIRHPAVGSMELDQSKIEDLLPVLAAAKYGPLGDGNRNQAMAALTQSDVPEMIAQLAAVKAQAVFSAGLEPLAWAEDVELPDLRPVPYAQAIASDLAQIPESGEFPDLTGLANISGQLIQCKLFGGLLSVDSTMNINDAAGVFLSLVASQAQGSARLVRKQTFAVLNENPELADGVPMFDASRGNIAAVAGLSADSVSAAISTLAQIQAKSVGDPLDLSARYLVVHSDQLMSARVICSAIYLPDSTPIIPIGSAFLDAGFWYLTPSPDQAACVARSSLKGDSISVAAHKPFELPTGAMKFRFTISHGAHAVSPFAVRGSMS